MTFAELTWEGWLTIGVIISTFMILVTTRWPADFVFLGSLSVLLLTGVLDAGEALEGFAARGMITVGVLYIVVAGLQETGGLAWISHHVLGRPKSLIGAQLRMMPPVTGMSAFLNNTPVVAIFVPVVVKWSRKLRISASKLLIPLSYASIFGGICTMIGTSTNLVVNSLYYGRYSEELYLFEITKIGLPCALFGTAYVLFLAKRILPERQAVQQIFENPREYTIEMIVEENGALVGKTIEQAGLRHLPGCYLAELVREDIIYSAVPPSTVLEGNDRLVFVGMVDAIRDLRDINGLSAARDQVFKLDAPKHDRCLVEAVVSNTCPMVGKSIRRGRFRRRYNAVVIAVARNGERIHGKIGDIVLRPGDTLLVESHAGFIPRQKDSRDFYLVSSVENSNPVLFEKAPIAFMTLMGMVALAGLNILSMLEAAVLAAGVMLLTGCCTPSRARHNIHWNVLLVIGAALGVGAALAKTGAADAVAHTILGMSGGYPWATLALVYIATNFFTEMITNNAAAAIIFPIAMNTAEQLSVNPIPFVMVVMIGASASFATPIGYQTNLMVYGPGGYRFSDFMKFGIPLNIIMGMVVVGLAPLIWGF
ncbi:MAG: SLC13 family permease [Verrucomicrobia bacterium]|nr:SLC13 family permease [Verrucomicrobiota bacterium]